MSTFSSRYGYHNRDEPIREDAPEAIRVGLREVLNTIGFNRPSLQRDVICQALRVRPNPNNWSDYPNVDYEVDEIIHGLPWFKFYDLCEKLNKLEAVRERGMMEPYGVETYFSHELNKLLSEENVIYRMDEEGEFHPEGSPQFEEATNTAHTLLN